MINKFDFFIYLYIKITSVLALNILGENEFAVARNFQVQIQVLSHPTQKQLPDRITATIHTHEEE